MLTVKKRFCDTNIFMRNILVACPGDEFIFIENEKIWI